MSAEHSMLRCPPPLQIQGPPWSSHPFPSAGTDPYTRGERIATQRSKRRKTRAAPRALASVHPPSFVALTTNS